MSSITFACVRVGDRYGPEYVERLRRGIARHYAGEHRFVVLTDRPSAAPSVSVDLRGTGLTGWWAKMALFEPNWRAGQRVVYLDLDTVLVGDLSPLAGVDAELGICENFTRLAGNAAWPCGYGSCAMVLNGPRTGAIWSAFSEARAQYQELARIGGDQLVIERLWPDATLLQRVLPPGYFLGYRDLPRHPGGPPAGCSVVVFAGRHKPDSTQAMWAKRAWEGS